MLKATFPVPSLPMSKPVAAPPILVQTTLATVVSTIARTLAGEYGIDPVPVLRSVDIDPAVMQDSESRLAVTTLTPLWLRCVELTGDETFGLRAARYHQPAQFYGIDLALCTSATFGEAIQRHVQYIRVITTLAQTRLSVDADGDHRLEVRRQGPHRPTDVAIDCFFHAAFIRLFRRQTGLSAGQLLRRLELSRAQPRDPSAWHALGVPVTFGHPCSAMVFKAECWALPLPGANPHLLARLEQPILQYLAQLGLTLPLSALRARLTDLLAVEPTPERLANALNISPALLLANLRAHALSFSQLLDQAREAQALVLLAEPGLSLEQVTCKLGLSSTSSLARAFRRWQGTTPLAYRRQVLG